MLRVDAGGESGDVYFYNKTQNEFNSKFRHVQVLSSSFVTGGDSTINQQSGVLTDPIVQNLPRNVIYARIVSGQRLM